MKTTTICMPMIETLFSADLLNTEMGIKPSSYYRDVYQHKIEKRYKPSTRKYQEYETLMELNQRLYEWKKAKKAYNKATEKEAMQQPTLPIEDIHRVRGLLGKTVRSLFAASS